VIRFTVKLLLDSALLKIPPRPETEMLAMRFQPAAAGDPNIERWDKTMG
jgi:hypothetical protein